MGTDTLKVLSVNYVNVFSIFSESVPFILQTILTIFSIIYMFLKIRGL